MFGFPPMQHSAELSGPWRKRVSDFTRDLRGLYDDDPEPLHRVRVASRRLRELLPLMPINGGMKHDLGKRLRRITRELGHVRERDVLWLITGEFSKSHHGERALGVVRSVIKNARMSARARFAEKLPRAKVERLAHRLARAGEDADPGTARQRAGTSSRAWIWALEARVVRRATQLQAAIE